MSEYKDELTDGEKIMLLKLFSNGGSMSKDRFEEESSVVSKMSSEDKEAEYTAELASIIANNIKIKQEKKKMYRSVEEAYFYIDGRFIKCRKTLEQLPDDYPIKATDEDPREWEQRKREYKEKTIGKKEGE